MSTVAGNEYAIGYCSLGSLNDTVKAVKIDGAEATTDNVSNGTYKVSRPFNIVTKDNVSDVAQDFINYIMSADGQQVITDDGYISVAEGETFTSTGASGKNYNRRFFQCITGYGETGRGLQESKPECRH